MVFHLHYSVFNPDSLNGWPKSASSKSKLKNPEGLSRFFVADLRDCGRAQVHEFTCSRVRICDIIVWTTGIPLTYLTTREHVKMWTLTCIMDNPGFVLRLRSTYRLQVSAMDKVHSLFDSLVAQALSGHHPIAQDRRSGAGTACKDLPAT